MRFNITVRMLALIVIMTFLFSDISISEEDQVIQAVNEGIQKYNEQKYGEAAGQFEYAAQLAKQKKGEQIKDFVQSIEPIEGWVGNQATSQAMAGGFMGGGVNVDREFTKDSSRMNLTILSDSPLIQSVIMLFSNPAMAAASGGELSTINGERVVIKFDPNNNSGEVKSVIDGKYLFTLDSRAVTKDDLINQTKNVNFQDLKAIP